MPPFGRGRERADNYRGQSNPERKDIFVLPDILTNAGGVVVPYFEWIQGLQNFFWEEKEVTQHLRDILVRAFHRVLDLSQKEKVDMRLVTCFFTNETETGK
jgi:glutamate dehydrogenase/leucine dehydrogenase